jgi:hypothetical protein
VPGSATFYLPDDTIFSTGTDTVNLSKKPVYLHVIASDMQTYRWYRIDINVHQVNPDLYVWTQLSDNIVPHEHYDSRAFCINHQFVLFVNNGLSTQIYTSKNASDWSAAAQPIGLPTPCHVRDIVQMGQTLYYIDKQQLYTSTDLIHWSATDYSSATFAPINMLMAYNEQAWCIIQDHASQRMQLATIDGTNIIPATNIEGLDQGFLPTSFPISDFAATAFTSSSERPRAMIVGGRSTNGSPLNSRWNLEYVPSTNDNAQGIYRLKDFTISQPTFHTLTGASIVEYGGHLIMFGGIDNDLEWNSNILYSKDEGMNWYQPDTANNQLPLTYGSRQNQSVIVEQNSIYLIGGQSASQAYSDVYQGYLNSLQFK